MQPAWARAADRRRPAMAAGFLLLAVLHPLSLPPPPRLLADAVALVDVLVNPEEQPRPAMAGGA